MAYENISQVSNLLEEGLDNYSDIRGLFKEEVLENDVVELLGDCSKVVKCLSQTKKIVDIGMFSVFLKGFYIGDETEKEKKKLKKLKEYVNDEDKAMFISKTLNKILDAKSKHAVFILGYMINTLIENEKRLNPKYVILADALTHMFNHDIEIIRFLGDYCNFKIHDNRKGKSKKSKKRDVYFNKEFKNLLKENDYDDEIVYLTLEKCSSYQLMIKNVESYTDLDLDGIDISYDKETDDEPDISTGTASANTEVEESYKMTVVGDLLYNLIIALDIKQSN